MFTLITARSVVSWAIGCSALMLNARAGAEPPRIVGVGVPAWAAESSASSVSEDGEVVLVSASFTSPTGSYVGRPGLWTEQDGLIELPILFDAPRIFALGMTADASQIVGWFSRGRLEVPDGVRLIDGGVRWVDGEVEYLDPLMSVPSSTTRAITPDGRWIVGYATGGPNGLGAFRWRADGSQAVEFLPIPPDVGPSYAEHVAANGAVVIGSAYGTAAVGGHRMALRWDGAGVHVLAPLPGYADARATQVSSDGSVMIGHSYAAFGPPRRACRWEDADVIDLGQLPQRPATVEACVSADGSIIGGYAADAAFQQSLAFIWTAPTGMVDLNDYLSLRAVDLSGWTLTALSNIGAGNRVLTGSGLHEVEPGVFRTEGWVVRLPVDPNCRADFNHVDGLTVQDLFDFLNAWFAGDARADVNGSGLSVQDVLDYLRTWLAGC